MLESARKSQVDENESDGLIQKSVHEIQTNDEVIIGTNFEGASSKEEISGSKV